MSVRRGMNQVVDDVLARVAGRPSGGAPELGVAADLAPGTSTGRDSAGSVEISAATPTRCKTDSASARTLTPSPLHDVVRLARPRRARAAQDRRRRRRRRGGSRGRCRRCRSSARPPGGAAARARGATSAGQQEAARPCPAPEWLKLRVQTTRTPVARDTPGARRPPAPTFEAAYSVSGRCSAVSSSGISSGSCRPYCSAAADDEHDGIERARRGAAGASSASSRTVPTVFTSYAAPGFRIASGTWLIAGEMQDRRRAPRARRRAATCSWRVTSSSSHRTASRCAPIERRRRRGASPMTGRGDGPAALEHRARSPTARRTRVPPVTSARRRHVVPAYRARSASTIICTSCVEAAPSAPSPARSRAFDGSPTSRSTSAGRSNFASCMTKSR